MKVTESGILKHRQLHIEDYLQMVSAEQKEYAEVCSPPKVTETDITNTNKQARGLLEDILTSGNLNRPISRLRGTKVQAELMACR